MIYSAAGGEVRFQESWHNQIMIRGRSRGVGIVNVIQRPKACHNTLISEAEHFFIYTDNTGIMKPLAPIRL